MKRKIYRKLLDWKEHDSFRKALLIEGARRVGKSFIVEDFAKNEYKSFILIDFNRVGDDVKELFNLYLNDLDTFFSYLSVIFNVKLYKHESLIIFDEVQLFPRARAAIKYLVADGRYSYIETGSLVSINENVQDILIPSEESRLEMFPMDFEEFLWALGQEMIWSLIVKAFAAKKSLGQIIHRKAMDLFRRYLIVGGMPQAVQTYIDSQDFSEVDHIKRDILALYRNDISKYSKRYTAKVKSIFDELPAQLQKHEKRFTLAALGKGSRFREYESAFLWLKDAKIINVCYNSTQPAIGLKMNMDASTLKCYMADTGLLISHSFDEHDLIAAEIHRKILLDKLEFNEGMIMENIVAQMLAASGHKLYFYSNPSKANAELRMEIDFLISKSKITNRHNISPIEVKSGKRYTLASLRKFQKIYAEQLDTPFVLHTLDFKEENGITYLPLYMAPLL